MYSIVRFPRAIGAGLAIVATAGVLSIYLAPAAKGEVADTGINTLQQLSDTYVRVAEDTSRAVVFIEVSKNLPSPASFGPGGDFDGFPFRRFFGPQGFGSPMPQAPQDGGMPQQMGTGSGFIISPDGYIVTNHHVAGEADGIKVTLQDGRSFDAKLIGSDPQTEVALVKVDADNLPVVNMGDSDAVKVGEWILAVGSPFGLDHTVTSGIISAQGRSEVGIVDYANFIQTDAAINPGNSGGPLINLRGEVIGMNTAILSSSGGNNGIGFAIPINMVKHVVEDIRDDGKVVRGFLGVNIQNLTPEIAQWFGVEGDHGALVAEVVEDSPAGRAGLQKDDIVLRFNGQPVNDAAALRSRVATTTPNSDATLEILRNGEKLEKAVRIGELDSKDMLARGTTSGENSRLGLRLQNLDAQTAAQLGYAGEQGVVVAQVEPGSQAQRAGIEPGMLVTEVNRQPVSDVKQFQEALEQGKKNDTVLLNVEKDGQSRYVAMKLS